MKTVKQLIDDLKKIKDKNKFVLIEDRDGYCGSYYNSIDENFTDKEIILR